jgi:hypothetical protein
MMKPLTRDARARQRGPRWSTHKVRA